MSFVLTVDPNVRGRYVITNTETGEKQVFEQAIRLDEWIMARFPAELGIADFQSAAVDSPHPSADRDPMSNEGW